MGPRADYQQGERARAGEVVQAEACMSRIPDPTFLVGTFEPKRPGTRGHFARVDFGAGIPPCMNRNARTVLGEVRGRRYPLSSLHRAATRQQHLLDPVRSVQNRLVCLDAVL